MIDMSKAASRPMAVAASLKGEALDEHAFYSLPVILTGEPDALGTENGRWIFLDSIRLLLRVVGVLTIVLPEGMDDLAVEANRIGNANFVRQPPKIQIGASELCFSDAKAILNVGRQPRIGAPWTSVSASGWLCRASSSARALEGDFNQPNPISSLFAASIGVSEVFKRLIGMSADAAPLIETLTYSLFNFRDDNPDFGPVLPQSFSMPNTLLVGAGAIGSGIGLLSVQLRLEGCLHVVDKQRYQDENLGTCVLMERAGWSGKGKAARLADWISSNGLAAATGERALIADAIGSEKCIELCPRVVLGGLDDVSARHDAQMLWPDLMIDGGINNLGAAVVQHRIDERRQACLRCTFSLPATDVHAIQTELTGLDGETLSAPDRPLTAEDLARASPEKQQWLRQRLSEGKTVCSIVSEATMAKFGANLERDFKPSVPFVATAAACLVMAEFTKYLLDRNAEYHQTSVVGNLFLGTSRSSSFNRAADPSCLCVLHHQNIVSMKAHRDADSI